MTTYAPPIISTEIPAPASDWELLARVAVAAGMGPDFRILRGNLREPERCPCCPATNTITRTPTGAGALTLCTACGWHYLDTGDLA